MLKKIFAFLIKIPHLLITLMRYLFSQDWHAVSSGSDTHYMYKTGTWCQLPTPLNHFFQSLNGRYHQVGKKSKGVMLEVLRQEQPKASTQTNIHNGGIKKSSSQELLFYFYTDIYCFLIAFSIIYCGI